MTYSVHLIKLFFDIDDHVFRIGKAEKIKNLWKLAFLLSSFSIFIYAGMGLVGIGTDMISNGAVWLTPAEYELRKFWFIIGRIAFAITLALGIIFIPSFLFYLITAIPYQKLIIMQLVVLFVMLLERIIWVPLVVYAGLDWYVSPFSFGIIASYLTDMSFLIYLFGSVSLFQLWIIWFQIKFLGKLATIHKGWIWLTVLVLHISLWLVTALLADADVHLIGGWFE
ncbi:hypothetical protein GMD78_20755 [Ornithinibacillus sp. L9]|uniref:Yip1 domain-containing protein n=1 Tax=Ornithinibacillus caprae TaxID=2678566 RepID=A0A6N8FQV4_9BACI|nr:hypothetical protein [Ornithinibacillus caprae]MUK90787.1 hypothetical protein [Ornithinibacillus caprae]